MVMQITAFKMFTLKRVNIYVLDLLKLALYTLKAVVGCDIFMCGRNFNPNMLASKLMSCEIYSDRLDPFYVLSTTSSSSH